MSMLIGSVLQGTACSLLMGLCLADEEVPCIEGTKLPKAGMRNTQQMPKCISVLRNAHPSDPDF
jgi:hypothetical protein